MGRKQKCKDMAGVKFDITGSANGFIAATRQAEAAAGKMARRVESEGNVLDSMFKKLASGAATLFTMHTAGRFVSEVANVRGEFQKLEVAFETMLQSKGKAEALMAQIVDTAAKTPFDLQGVANGAKQLLAYGVASENVNDTLIRLGDIAAGLSIPLGDLVYLYGTTMAQGRMFTMDLRQFQGRGVPMAEALAEVMGVTKQEVSALVTEGKVGFPEMQKAIESMTDAGGKFAGLMEKQSQTITGQISNLKDSIQQAFNEIGEQSEGAISGALDIASGLVENYEKIGRILAGLVSTYGAYRAASMAVIALQKLQAVTSLASAVAHKKVTAATLIAAKAQKALNATMLANPYVLIATAITAAGAALLAFGNNAKDAADYTDELNEAIEGADKAKGYDRLTAEYEELKGKTELTKDETEKFRDVVGQLAEAFPDAVTQANEWGEALDVDLQKIKSLNDETKALKIEQLTQQIKENREALRDVEMRAENVANAKAAVDAGQSHYQHRSSSGFTTNRAYKRYGGAKGASVLLELKEEATQLQNNITEAEKYVSILNGTYQGTQATTTTTTPTKTAEEIEKERQEREKRRKAAEKSGEQLRRTTEQLEFDIRQGAINAMQDGFDRENEQLRLNYDKQMKEYERAQSELLRQMQENELNQWLAGDSSRKAENFIPTITEDSAEFAGIVDMYARLGEQAKAAYDAAVAKNEADKAKGEADEQSERLEKEKEAMWAYLEEYGTFEQKKSAIREKYAKMIEDAETEGDKLMLDAKMKDALAQLEIDADSATNAVSQLFGDMTDKAVKDLQSIAENGAKALEFLKGGKWDEMQGAELGLSKETFETLSRSPEMLAAISSALLEVKRSADSLKSPMQKLKDGFIDLFNAGGDANKLTDAFAEISAGMGVITETAGFVSDSLSKLGEATGNEGLTKVADGIQSAITVAEDTMQGAKLGKDLGLGPIGMAAGAAIGLVTSLVTEISKAGDKKHQRQIEAYDKKIKGLEKSYDLLGKQIDKAFSSDASGLIAQQNTLLEQQKELIRLKIAEEEAKKDSDATLIAEWKQQLEDLDGVIADNKAAAIDAIFGADLNSAIEGFAVAYADAWTEGTKGAATARDFVRNMMRDMVTESIKAAIQASGKMEAIRQQLQQYFADGVLSEWEQEQIYKKADELQAELDRKYGWAEGLMTDEGESTRAASSKGIAQASQSSVDELNGRMTAVQSHTFSINQHLASVVNITSQILAKVTSIDTNTAELYEINDRISRMSSTLDDIFTRGIRIKG